MPSEEIAQSNGISKLAPSTPQMQEPSEAGSEEAFFFARSLDLFSVIGLDGYFKRVNPAFTQTLGYPEAEFLAHPFIDFVHPDDHAATRAEMEKLKAGAPTLYFENRYRAQDGSYRCLVWTASPQIERGVLYCVARDMTQQKQTEVALQTGEERWQLALRGSNDGVWDWNVQTNEVFFSTRWKTMLGYEEHEVSNHLDEWKQRVHPDDLTWVMQTIQDHFAQKTPFYVTEHRVLCKDGSYKWILDRGQAIWNEDGTVLRMIGSHTDVTERRELEFALQRVNQQLEQRVAERTLQLEQANAALQESQKLLQRQLAEIETIYQSAPIGLNVLDADLRFVRINEKLAEINGFSVEEHIGRTVRELLPDIADTAEALLRPIFETGEPLLNVEVVGETPAQPGVQRVWLESFLPLKDGDRVIGISTVCEEITERKRSEEALRENEERLRMAIAQEQAAREAAERANRMKDEFLAILSHELRTPLNPILGWAKLLQTSNPSSERLQHGLSTIERNARQQAQLIDDLLDISRIIRGKITLNFATIFLSEPIAAALETVRLAAEAKLIALDVQLDPAVGQVKGDAGRLQQMVWNLLSNAIKFTPTGGRVTVRLEKVVKDRVGESLSSAVSTPLQSYAQITVSDTGKGVHPDFLPYVFELFRQQDSSTTRSFGGLGLGLAIARQVVEAHGGIITVASAGEGQGATFTVQLPLMYGASHRVPHSSAPQPAQLGENLRVMVVDDEVDSLDLIRAMLEQEGAIVTTVTSATNALQVLAQAQFDLLISDIGMPQIDGYAFIRKLRTLPPHSNRDIPAIALTAYIGETNQNRAFEAGYQIHLAKPIDPNVLFAAITQLVHHHR
ncbi:PAS domain S-box protein [Oscillatoria sp. FACHB-1407]|uniref:PAS domain-containing hybrid sensor histidine kinase/response regulator n=1 Tax=Oscillatoria sp. FACHB-1407 TaxID=2692847 RepID=UPI001688E223|nr:PAS domain S-box protein [Oscillatoria sp. FACHB-1407]MBD2462586.1 PAS domain S-box protein [Oscillatoria sp. FACHB-1407]